MSVISTKEFVDVRVDVMPVVLARPILTPPGSFSDPIDPPLFAYRCPYSGDVKLIDEPLTIWPTTIKSDGLPVVLRLGQAIFIGPHLLKPEKQERLKAVLGKVYEDDRTFGHTGRWVDSRAVTSAWQAAKPAPAAKPSLFQGPRRSDPLVAVKRKPEPVPAA